MNAINRINRGGWMPVGNPDTCLKWRCPTCGEEVCMFRGTPTYPTCPFCLSEIPGWEDFETPEQLRVLLRQSTTATGKRYCFDEEEKQRHKERRHNSYIANRDAVIERQKKYNEEHKAERNEYLKRYMKDHPEKRREYEKNKKK